MTTFNDDVRGISEHTALEHAREVLEDSEVARVSFNLLQKENKLSRPVGKKQAEQHCQTYLINEEVKKPPPRGPLETGLRREIERMDVTRLTPEIFFKWYVHLNRPVLISGASHDLFEGFPDQWTPGALSKSEHSDLKQPVVQQQARVIDKAEDELTIKEIFDQKGRTVLFEKYEFDVLQSEPAEPQNWMYQQTYFQKLRSTNTFLNSSHGSDTFNLHVSNQGGALPHSHSPTLNLCMYGAKRWIMVDPFEYTGLNVTDGRETFEMMEVWGSAAEGATSQAWFDEKAVEDLNRLRITYYDFILKAGEAVYIPNFWTHATMDLCRETVGVELKGHLVTSDWVAEGTTRFQPLFTWPLTDPYNLSHDPQ